METAGKPSGRAVQYTPEYKSILSIISCPVRFLSTVDILHRRVTLIYADTDDVYSRYPVQHKKHKEKKYSGTRAKSKAPIYFTPATHSLVDSPEYDCIVQEQRWLRPMSVVGSVRCHSPPRIMYTLTRFDCVFACCGECVCVVGGGRRGGLYPCHLEGEATRMRCANLCAQLFAVFVRYLHQPPSRTRDICLY